MESGGRTPEERRAAAEARARARRDEPAAGDDELMEGTGPRGAEGAMTRHYGGPDVYVRRRLIAGAVVVVLIVLIFLLLVAC
jgi:hypothetical protein